MKLKKRGGFLYFLIPVIVFFLLTFTGIIMEVHRVSSIQEHIEYELQRAVNIAVEDGMRDSWRQDKLNKLNTGAARNSFYDYIYGELGLNSRLEKNEDGQKIYTLEITLNLNKEPPQMVVAGTIGAQLQPANAHWATNYIEKAIESNLIDRENYAQETWDDSITRQAMARIVDRCAEYVLGEEKVEDTSKYTERIADWEGLCEKCKPSIAQAYAKGILTGYTDGTFAGAKTMTRAEAVTTIVRLIDKSMRPELIGNVFFNKKTDTAEDTRMKLAKAEEYMYQTISNTKIYKENGKYYLSVTYPELPEGFEHWFSITIERKNDKPLIYL